MNVYHVNNDTERFKYLTSPVRSDFEQLFRTPFGQKLGSAWKGLRVYNRSPDAEDYPGDLPAGDFVGITASEIGVTPKALAIVGDALRACGELLSVDCPDHPDPLLWFHPTQIVDALDVAHSDARPIGDSGKLFVSRFGFFADRLGDAVIFKVPQSRGFTFCTDTFKSLVESNGLTGLSFGLAWSDEPFGIARLEKLHGPMPGSRAAQT
jgi:hypothetical protein